MKKLVLTLLFGVVCFYTNAQNPDLYQTWYLVSYEYDLGEIYYVSDIDPPISPFMTIDENLNFTGQACNEYGGVFSYISNDDTLLLEEFDLCLCGTCNNPPQSHIDFEDDYFDYFIPSQVYNYELYHVDIPDEDPFDDLILFTFAGFDLRFRNIPILSTPDNKLNRLKIFPNPASDKINIYFGQNKIDSFTIYSISGQKVLEVNSQTNSINVSALPKGMYFMEVSTSEGKIMKKFIKK